MSNAQVVLPLLRHLFEVFEGGFVGLEKLMTMERWSLIANDSEDGFH